MSLRTVSRVIYAAAHAGRGLLHDETPLPGEVEIVQLWINSPARHKMDTPSYHPLSPEATPAHQSPDELVTLHMVAGELGGVKGPIRTLTLVNAATIDARRGGQIEIELPRSHNAFLYLLDGALRFADGTAPIPPAPSADWISYGPRRVPAASVMDLAGCRRIIGPRGRCRKQYVSRQGLINYQPARMNT